MRTRPAHVQEDQEITLVAVIEPDREVGERARPRFVVKRGRRQIGRSIEGSPDEDGVRTFTASHTFTRPGTYSLIFRMGSGADRIEMSTEVEVHRDPDRPRPTRRGQDPDPPPVTTQGSAWQPPTIAPAWTQTPSPTPAPDPDPPPPPAPWTGSVL